MVHGAAVLAVILVVQVDLDSIRNLKCCEGSVVWEDVAMFEKMYVLAPELDGAGAWANAMVASYGRPVKVGRKNVMVSRSAIANSSSLPFCFNIQWYIKWLAQVKLAVVWGGGSWFL